VITTADINQTVNLPGMFKAHKAAIWTCLEAKLHHMSQASPEGQGFTDSKRGSICTKHGDNQKARGPMRTTFDLRRWVSVPSPVPR